MSDHSRGRYVFMPLIVSLAVVAGIFLGIKVRDISGSGHLFRVGQSSGVFDEIMDLVSSQYVDSVHLSDLRQEAIQGMLKHLDPHTVYIPSKELAAVNEDLDGSFEGIGVQFFIWSDTLNVTSVIPGGPAAQAGLQIGDRILQVGDSVIAGNHSDANRIRSILRGPGGSKVNLTILRLGKTFSVSLTRGKIPLYSIDASYLIRPGVGYIKINRFAANTYDEFMTAMTALKKQGMQKLILDLRGNPGGFLDAATRIADEFLDSTRMVVYTKGLHYPKTAYRTGKPGIFETQPLVILIDEGSASAAEILSGAIQDWDRGILIGRRSFGKGLVQEQFDLSNGAALRLTVARYYIPSGRCIQKSYADGIQAYEDDFMDRYKDGELLHADSIHHTDPTPYYTRILHRRVYGGGGITPDLFVPIDTVSFDGRMATLYASNAFYNFAYRYFVAHRSAMQMEPSASAWLSDRAIDPELMKGFERFVQTYDSLNLEPLPVYLKHAIGLQLKASLAREIWQRNGYYQVLNTQDSAVNEAIHVLDSGITLKSLDKS